MFNPYTQFKRLYPKTIQIETLIIIFHIFRKTFLNQGRNMGDTSVSGGTFLMLGCIFLNFWIVYRNSRFLKESISQTRLFLMYTIFCMFSFFWAVTGLGSFSSVVLKDVEVISSYLALSVVLYKIRDLYLCMIYILYIATIAALCGGIAQGFQHTNSYSVSAMIGTILAVGLKKIYNPKYINYFIVANMLPLIMGTSSGTYIAFICSLLVLFSTDKKGIKITQSIIVAGIVYFIYSFAGDYIYSLIFYGKSVDAIEGGTGRYEVWEQFIHGWELSPWLGHGFVVGERNLFLLGGHEMIFSAHNGYLSVLVNTGLLGMSIWGGFVIKTIINGLGRAQVKNPAQTEAAILFAALCGILINNISYPLCGSDWNHTFPPMMCVLIMLNTLKGKEINLNMKYILTKHVWKTRKNQG